MTANSGASYLDGYTKGWNEHDPEMVVDQFAEDGTYFDPVVGETLRRQEFQEYVDETIRTFPDLHIEKDRTISARDDDDLVHTLEWTMYATHDGPLGVIPPTGNEIEFEGADVFTVSDDGITSVRSYFDQRDMFEQLDLTFPAVVGQLPKLAVGAARGVL